MPMFGPCKCRCGDDPTSCYCGGQYVEPLTPNLLITWINPALGGGSTLLLYQGGCVWTACFNRMLATYDTSSGSSILRLRLYSSPGGGGCTGDDFDDCSTESAIPANVNLLSETCNASTLAIFDTRKTTAPVATYCAMAWAQGYTRFFITP